MAGARAWVNRILYTVTGFDHQAVLIFFVLSGFFIGSSIFRGVARGTWSWRNYAVDRGSRLYVVLIPAAILGVACDRLGMALFNGSGIYSHPLTGFEPLLPANGLTVVSFAGTLLFLESRFTPVLGSNGGLWTLFCEFWFYVLFPALLGALLSLRRRSFGPAAVQLILAAVTIWILRYTWGGFLIWLSGAAVALTANYLRFGDSRRWIRLLYGAGTGAIFSASLASTRVGHAWPGGDLTLALSFALVLHGAVQFRLPTGSFGLMLASRAAGFSYSLYLLHFPLLLLIRAAVTPASRWQPDPVHLAYWTAIVAATLVYAHWVARLTEWHTPAVRTWLRREIGA